MKPQDFFDMLNFRVHKNGTENNYVYKAARAIVRMIANSILPVYIKCSKDNMTEKKRASSVIVSLTSFPARINQIWYTIKTLKRQSIVPEKIILWLSKEQFPNMLSDVPARLYNELDNLFEIKFVDDDLRPHKKYYYSFMEYSEKIVITVDDDIFYNSRLVESLLESYKKHPQCVICNRGHHIKKNSVYSRWETIRYAEGPSYNIIPTGVGGVLYPPHCYDEHVFSVEAIKKTCLNADDLWLNFMIRYKGTQVVATGLRTEPIAINSSQKEALCKTNNGIENENDIQIKNINTWAEKELKVDYFVHVQ